MAPVQSITDITLLSFFTNTADENVYLVVHYHLFLHTHKKNKIERLYSNENNIH